MAIRAAISMIKKNLFQKLPAAKAIFTIDLSEQTFSVLNKNIVVVRQTFNSKTNDFGKPAKIVMYVMLVWQKQHGD